MNLKNIFQIYTLFVCLICTVILIVTAALFLNSVTNLIIPQYKHYSSLIQYESNENYMRHVEHSYGINKERLAALKQLSATQLDETRASDKRAYLEEQKGYAIEMMIRTLEWALIALIFFFIHWRLYKRSKG